MALRFSCKNVSITAAGITFNPALTGPSSANAVYTAQTADEWAFNYRGAAPAGATNLYLAPAPAATTFIVASTSGTATADVFAWVNLAVTT